MIDDKYPAKWRLLDAAVDLFAARGFQAVTLADVAIRAGIAPPTAVYHFGTKEALYRAALSVALEEVRPAMPAPDADGETAVAGLVRDLSAAVPGDALARLLAFETLKPTGHLAAVLDGWTEGPLAAARAVVRRVIGPGDARDGRVDALAWWLLGQCLAPAASVLARPPEGGADAALRTAMIVAGLKAGAAPTRRPHGLLPPAVPAAAPAARRLKAVRAAGA